MDGALPWVIELYSTSATSYNPGTSPWDYMKVDCPKCASPNARYVKTETDLHVQCFCGYLKCVFTTLKDIEVEHNELPQDVKLPREGTNMHETLVCLWAIEPANSREVTDTLILRGHDFNVSDVSSYLMMLRSKGLVRVLDYRRGVPGGSTWELTEVADKLLGV